MKINRMIGLLIFLFVAQILLHDVFSATSRAIVSTMGTVEVASQTVTHTLERIER